VQDVGVLPDDELLTPLREAVAAVRAGPLTPVRLHNKLMTAVQRECDRLAATTEGRVALVHAAVNEPESMVRLSAAVAVTQWDRESGASALQALVVESGGLVVRPMTMTAALAVRDEPGRAAALCLLNVDRGETAAEVSAAQSAPRRVAVPTSMLDAAQRVYGLAMNGGVEHAYEVAGGDFDAAATGLDAVGANVAADVLRRVAHLLGVAPETAATEDVVARLDEQFAATDVMKLLEAVEES
jgi:hypothetical protein